MGKDSMEELRAKIREQMRKEAEQEVAEEMARFSVELEEEKYNDEWISKKYGVPVYKVERFREDHKRLVFAKQLEITIEPQYIEDDLVSKCLPKEMYVKNGKLDGSEHMLLLGLHATGLKPFLELISEDTKEELRRLLNDSTVQREEDKD